MSLSITSLLLALFIIHEAQAWWFLSRGKRKCFDRLELGCFSADPPFSNSQALPRSPGQIGVKFRFYTSSPSVYHTLSLRYRLRKVRSRNVFRPYLDTKVIIHGFQDNGENAWVQQLIAELLKSGPMNVIVVDWRKGARILDYQQAVADIRVIGAIVAKLLARLQREGADPATFHLIGHSLGAHIAGHVGRRNGYIGRITGLDPAGPSFEEFGSAVRLDKTDAAFVDVIHSDTEPLVNMGLGIKRVSGHMDFYPNGGVDQPGCPPAPIYMLAKLFTGSTSFVGAFACSHMRSVHYFTESINSQCHFHTRRCTSVKNITYNACTDCPSGGCPLMGYHAQTNMVPGIYYTATANKSPYCLDSNST